MGLVVGNERIKSKFLSQWTTKYIPAILMYGKKVMRKNIARHVMNVDEASK